jgi:cytochrome b561
MLMAQARYTNVAIALHWIIALAILTNVALAWAWPHSLPDDAVRPAIDFHKSLGVTVFGLALLRILWRFANPPPPMPSTYQKWEMLAAHGAHILLYVIMFAMPLTGWLMDSAWKDAASHPMQYFGTFEFPRFGPFMDADLAEKKKLHDVFGEAHELFAWLFYFLFAAHVGGALKHQILDREPELARMGVGKTDKAA